MSSPRVERVVAALVGETEQVAKVLTVELTAELATGTPFDTRHAASNWIPNAGAPAPGPIGSNEAVTFAAQDAGVARIVSGYRVGDGEIHVTNVVPYIRKLEDGWSPQKPSGFVKDAIAAAMARASAVLRAR